MIKISHEVPLSLLEESEKWNDYQYALVHLFDRYPSYAEYFKKAPQRGIHVILDNSLFELKKMFDADKFAKTIEECLPTEYIIPDAWENAGDTIQSVLDWTHKYKGLPGKKIGVIQGKNWEELTLCYKAISSHVDKIAVSFKPVAFGENEKDNPNFLLDCGINRYAFLSYLYNENLSGIKEKKPLHLLGCSLPQEFTYYRNAHFREYIETLDTSNPVIHAAKNVSYNPNGLHYKSTTGIEEIMELKDIDSNILLHNVRLFRKFVERKDK